MDAPTPRRGLRRRSLAARATATRPATWSQYSTAACRSLRSGHLRRRTTRSPLRSCYRGPSCRYACRPTTSAACPRGCGRWPPTVPDCAQCRPSLAARGGDSPLLRRTSRAARAPSLLVPTLGRSFGRPSSARALASRPTTAATRTAPSWRCCARGCCVAVRRRWAGVPACRALPVAPSRRQGPTPRCCGCGRRDLRHRFPRHAAAVFAAAQPSLTRTGASTPYTRLSSERD